MLNRGDLLPYQKHSVEFALKERKCGLFLDMGLGKTVISLTAASDMIDDFFIGRVLIVAPLRVANTVWKQESQKWKHLHHLKIATCTGSENHRRAALASNADIHIINRENIRWLVNECVWRWDMVIVDESSSFKSIKAYRFQALKKASKVLKAIVLLSGTPSPNSIIDLWSQMFLIDGGRRLGQFKKQFERSYGYVGYHGWEQNANANERVKDAIKDKCIYMSASDYLELPDRIDIHEYVTLPDAIQEKYKRLEKKFLLSLQDVEIAATSHMALLTKLLQMCNGAVYDEEGATHHVHDEKIDALREIVDDNGGENFLVAYSFKSDLKRLQAAFPYAVVLSRSGKEIIEWNKGNIRIMLAHPLSAAHGLNPQYGGSVVVWFGLNRSLELYLQFNARLHRQGQTKPVRVIHIMAKDCMDEKILKALERKASNQAQLLNYLKYI